MQAPRRVIRRASVTFAALAVVGAPLAAVTAAHADEVTPSDTVQASPTTAPSTTSTPDPASSGSPTTPTGTTDAQPSASSDTAATVTSPTSDGSPSTSDTGTTSTGTGSPTATSPTSTGTSDSSGSPDAFKPYDVSHDWYGPSPDTKANPWAVPQTSKVLTCGGIVQHDVYTISSQKAADDYAARLALGYLTGPQDDAEFAPHDYTVTDLPACVIVPPQPPALVVPTVSHLLVCGDGFYYTTTSTVTTPYVYDETTNSWVLGTPGAPVVDTTKVQATPAQCPPVVVVPPVKPTPPAVRPITLTAHAKPAQPILASPVAVPEGSRLAFTGSSEDVAFWSGVGGLLFLGGTGLVVAARVRRRS